jgi:peptidyl-prolyl cis-trans isomerase C
VISRAAIAREIQNHPASKPLEAWLAAARALVVRQLLLDEARRLAIAPTPLADTQGRRETDEEALIRTVVEREVTTPTAGDEECRRYYDVNRKRFRSADLYEVRHILIAAAPGDAEARAKARAEATALIAALDAGTAKFAEIAASCSACPSARTGGSLGQIGPGQTVPEFESALGDMAEGEISPAPVETRYGFHVVAVDRRIEGRELPFDIVRDRIAEWLDEKVRRTAIRQYIGMLAGCARIEGIELAASASPLTQ